MWEILPDKKCFYESLKDGATGDNGEKLHGHITDEEYLTCIKIWNKFNMKNTGDYYGHYSWCFWKVYWHMFKILQTRTLPLFQFHWIKMRCDVKNDWCKIRKHFRHWHVLIYYKRLRRGISNIWNRHTEVNNKYMKNYDPTKLWKYISHLDMNNLYVWEMSQYLSYGNLSG